MLGRSIRLSLLVSLLVLTVITQVALAADGKIYVIREPGGAMRFTSKPPSNGEQAEVFTARSDGFSYYRTPRAGRGRGSRKLHSAAVYERAIFEAARRHRVDPNLIKAVIHVESGFNPRAVSPKGAKGLMQLMPGTARGLGVSNVFDTDQNLMGTAKLITQHLSTYSRNNDEIEALVLSLAAYNAGPGAVRRFGGVPPYRETQNYVKKVMSTYRQLCGQPG